MEWWSKEYNPDEAIVIIWLIELCYDKISVIQSSVIVIVHIIYLNWNALYLYTWKAF